MPSIYEAFLATDPRVLKALSLIGLSKTDLKAYMVILSEGPSTAREIADRVGIASAKIYSVLSRLEKIGLIVKDMGQRPAIYMAVPPEDAWFELKRRLMAELENIEKVLIPFLESIRKGTPYYRVAIVGSSEVESMAVRIIEDSKSKVLRLAIPFPELITDKVVEALRKVAPLKTVKILASEEVLHLIPEDLPLDVRVTKTLFGGGIVGDQVLLIVRTRTGIAGMWSSHEYFTHIATIYFDKLWEEASSNP